MSYPDDPALRASTLSLLGGIWTRLPAVIAEARTWGVDWTEVSTPFVELVDGRVIAHVGVLELPVVLEGRRQTIAGVHAVCADPEHRRRGHVRAAMERALAWIDARYPTAILWANDPRIYGRFGFTPREESIFYGSVVGGSTGTLVPLSLDRLADVELVRARLATRTAVSNWISGDDRGWLSLLDLALWSPRPSLALIPELDCIVVYRVRERFLDLYDVIADRIPTRNEIASRLGQNITAMVSYIGPEFDRESPPLIAEPTTLDDQLMVRGAWPAGERPFALSPIARC